MRKMISLAIAVSMVVVLGQIGLASSFKIVGTRPLGMGGAFVAVAEDAIAQYWNPAGFALQKGLDIQILAGGSYDRTVAHINGGLNIRYRNLGIGVINITEMTEELIGSDHYLDLRLSGIMLFEAPITYARELPWLKNLYVGGNFKPMYGIVVFHERDVFLEAPSKGLFKYMLDYSKTSTTIGVDIGALYDLKQSLGLRFGMVVRNLNYPSFAQRKEAKEAGLDKYVIEPQVRVGVAYWPLKFITLSADLDVTNNKTVLPGYGSRMLCLGAEINILNKSWLNLVLRGGFMDNLSVSYGSIFTAGLGLNLFHLNLDFAFGIDPEEIKWSYYVPFGIVSSVGLSFNF